MMSKVCSENEKGRSPFEILTGKPIEKEPLESSRCSWEDKIRRHLKE